MKKKTTRDKIELNIISKVIRAKIRQMKQKFTEKIKTTI